MTGERVSRRGFLAYGAAAATITVAGCATYGGGNRTSPTSAPVPDGLPAEVGVTQVASGLGSPVDVVATAERTYVVDQVGVVHLVDADGVAEEPYLDLRDRTVDVGGYSERGLLGLALHPDFADNGRLFVRYSSPPRAETPTNYDHTFVLSEFRTDPGARQVDPATESVLLTIPEPQANHNAGALAFGPDGYLYVATGDGGGAGDRGNGHVDDWYDANPGGNGQDVTRNLLGSILRIDVDGSEPGRNYGIPDDNPLVDREGLPEHYAWGFRNPWRLSFGPDGRLFVADVGQSDYEEIDVVKRGGNYGWNVREGAHCFGADGCPAETPHGDPLRDPVVEYAHDGNGPNGVAVVGGYLYDGAAVPELQDRYVFADWQADRTLFVATPTDEGLWPISTVPLASESVGSYVLSFGRDRDGELLVCTTDSSSVGGSTGAVHRLGPA